MDDQHVSPSQPQAETSSSSRDPWSRPAVGLVTGVVALLTAIGKGVAELAERNDTISAVGFGVLGLAVVAALIMNRRRAPPRPLPATETFQALGPLTSGQRWMRQRIVHTIRDKISAGGVVAVVGPSGAGKSILLRELLPPALNETAIYCAHRAEWPDDVSAYGCVVVLDQFEHALLGLPWGSPAAEARLADVRTDVSALIQTSHALVLGVRDDWYIRLTFMRDMLPSLKDTTLISHSGLEADPEVTRAFEQRLNALLPGVPTRPLPVATTPMALQAVGQLVELAIKDRTLALSPGTFPDPDVALEQLTRLVASRAPSEEVVLRTLHALTGARERGVGLATDHIVATTGDLLDDVSKSLVYLRKAGLVVSRDARDELTHDALVTSVERVTSDFLDPSQRDSIRVGAQNPRAVVPPNTTRTPLFPWIIYTAILGIVTARVLVPIDGFWYHFSAFSPPDRTGILDPLAFLAAIPHLTWCFYIARHQMTIYRYVDRSKRQTFVSYLDTSLLLLVIIWAALMIEWWLAAIALGGLMQGVKSLQYGRDKTRPRSVRRLWEVGASRTFNNMAVLLVAGIAFALAVPSAGWTQDEVRFSYLVGSVMLTNAGWYLYSQHLAKHAAARSRGLLSRRDPSPSEYMDARGIL